MTEDLFRLNALEFKVGSKTKCPDRLLGDCNDTIGLYFGHLSPSYPALRVKITRLLYICNDVKIIYGNGSNLMINISNKIYFAGQNLKVREIFRMANDLCICSNPTRDQLQVQ